MGEAARTIGGFDEHCNTSGGGHSFQNFTASSTDGTSAYSLRAAYAMAVPDSVRLDPPPGTRTVTEPNP
jgi:hypothetical protein